MIEKEILFKYGAEYKINNSIKSRLLNILCIFNIEEKDNNVVIDYIDKKFSVNEKQSKDTISKYIKNLLKEENKEQKYKDSSIKKYINYIDAYIVDTYKSTLKKEEGKDKIPFLAFKHYNKDVILKIDKYYLFLAELCNEIYNEFAHDTEKSNNIYEPYMFTREYIEKNELKFKIPDHYAAYSYAMNGEDAINAQISHLFIPIYHEILNREHKDILLIKENWDIIMEIYNEIFCNEISDNMSKNSEKDTYEDWSAIISYLNEFPDESTDDINYYFEHNADNKIGIFNKAIITQKKIAEIKTDYEEISQQEIQTFFAYKLLELNIYELIYIKFILKIWDKLNIDLIIYCLIIHYFGLKEKILFVIKNKQRIEKAYDTKS